MQVNAFIVRKGTPGVETRKIEHKTALRCVQNADIFLTNVFVPESDRLPGVQSFQDTNKVPPSPACCLPSGHACSSCPGCAPLSQSLTSFQRIAPGTSCAEINTARQYVNTEECLEEGVAR